MSKQVVSVSQLTKYVKSLITNDMLLSGVTVKGEISNFKEYTLGGTWYFTLKDELAQIRCVIFANVVPKIKFKPEDGLSVLVSGKVSVFEKRGEYSLQVFFMEPEGVGAEALALEQLKEKLQKEGLFDLERKKGLPPFPKTIAVLASPSGAAVHDVIAIAKKRDPSIQIIVVPTIVQGEAGARSVVAAIKKANDYQKIEVLILARGGGAKEELSVFNQEIVARAIASSTVPVVSAVGHEIDVTIADLVADKRAPTPSAAAEIVVPDMKSYQIRVMFFIEALQAKLREQVLEFRQRAERSLEDLQSEFAYTLNRKKNRVEHAIESLEYLNPLLVLKRGYSVTLSTTGAVLTKVTGVSKGDHIETKLSDGSIMSIVE